MKKTRLDLQYLLEDILGNTNVYFQPPDSVKLQYQCIVYSREKIQTRHADNVPYTANNRYKITVISKTPLLEAVDKIAMLPMCVHVSNFISDILYHDVFQMYF
jgi:hypothetical protein